MDGIDHTQINEIAAAALFYQYISEQEDDFLLQHDYSKEDSLIDTSWSDAAKLPSNML